MTIMIVYYVDYATMKFYEYCDTLFPLGLDRDSFTHFPFHFPCSHNFFFFALSFSYDDDQREKIRKRDDEREIERERKVVIFRNRCLTKMQIERKSKKIVQIQSHGSPASTLTTAIRA